MNFIQYLKSLICGVLRFVRTYFWRVLSINLGLPYTRQINMESDNECEFDSTWEDECENKQPRKKLYRMSHRNEYAAKDMQNFRHSCRNLDDDDSDSDNNNDDDDDVESNKVPMYNLKFYRGEIKSSPDDVHINEFHKKWKGQYDWLENCHSYIQWLFPIQEPGVNWEAHVLTKKEIKVFRKDEEAKRRLVKSYKLLLDFYGIRLVNEITGEVKRADNWEERFWNLNRYSHNNLRITRILKCLGTLGLQHYQAPLVKFFLHETLVEGQLRSVKQSVLDYFMFTVLDKSDRRELVKIAFKNFKPREQFVWGPKKILSGEVDEENNNSNAEELRQRRELDKRTDEVNNADAINHDETVKQIEASNHEETVKQIDASNPDETVKQNQKVSDGDDKKLGEVHGENENFGQLGETRTTEEGQQRETSEGTQEVNQTDVNNPVKSMEKQNGNEKDQQGIDIQPVTTSSENNNKGERDELKTEKQDQETSDDGNEEHCKPHENFDQATEFICSNTADDKQEKMKPNQSTNEMNKMDASYPPEGMGNETPCKRENRTAKPNHEMSVGDGDDDDDDVDDDDDDDDDDDGMVNTEETGSNKSNEDDQLRTANAVQTIPKQKSKTVVVERVGNDSEETNSHF